MKSDNECFNSITDVKASICRKRGIYVKINIMNRVLNKLNDSEIGVIFGNVFDNAIRAAEASTEKTIELEVKRAGEYLFMVMMNFFEEDGFFGCQILV